MRIAIILDYKCEEFCLDFLPSLVDCLRSSGNTVQLILQKKDLIFACALSSKVELIVLDEKSLLLALLNPLSGVQRWFKDLRRWGDADVAVCFSRKMNVYFRFVSSLKKINVPILFFNVKKNNKYTEFMFNKKKILRFSSDNCIQRKKKIFNVDISQIILILEKAFIDSLPAKMEVKKNEKILWVEFGGLGDVAQSIADIYLLKENNPGIKTFILTKPQWQGFARSQECIDGVVCGDKRSIRAILSTAKRIRKEKFDRMSDISEGGSRTFILQLLANVPKKVPFCTRRIREKKLLFADADSIVRAEKRLFSLCHKRLLVCPGSGGTKLKLWPADHWKDFLTAVIMDGWNIVLIGSGEEERMQANQITSSLPSNSFLNLIDSVPIEDILGIAVCCNAAVGNDTGLLHLAALAGVPTVGIFSHPTSWRVGFRMPWFSEVAADNEIKRFRWEDKRTSYVLPNLKPDEVLKEFRKLTERVQQDN